MHAAPAFSNAVRSRFDPRQNAINSSSCGAWQKQIALSADFRRADSRDNSRKNPPASAPGSKYSDFSIFVLECFSTSAKISAVFIARTYGLEKNTFGESARVAKPCATYRLVLSPSEVI